MSRTYSELIKLKTFKERFEYLCIHSKIGEQTFGSHRYLNQQFYRSSEWRKARREVIKRDKGLDLGCEDHPIVGRVYVHHIDPITIEDLQQHSKKLFDLDNLISTSFDTSQAIHYGDFSLLEFKNFEERKPGDTKLW